MKKTGKYEKKPKAGDLLLQTYLTSMVSLILCVSMFLGTSYAWFTSEVTNTQNEIYVGTLKVGLYKTNGTAEPLDLGDETSNHKLFSNAIRWEPGYTALETIEIVNEGDLAFKYVLNFIEAEAPKQEGTENEGTESADVTEDTNNQVDLATVAQYFDVWVYDYYDNGGKFTKPDSYVDLKKAAGWERVGTLSEVLAGKAVLEGVMETVRYTVLEEGSTEPTNDGTTDGKPTTDTYTIALHMNENAPSSVMGQKITLNVKLLAYQKAEEKDDFGNDTYDTMVVTAEALKEALASGGTVALATDIDLKDLRITIPAGVSTVLDLNGHTISQTKECTESYSMIDNNGHLTITGNGKLSFKDTGAGDPDVRWASYTVRNNGTLIVENGTIEHLGTQTYNGNNAIFHYAGSLTINGGAISAPYSRSVRVWHGEATINGGAFDGQVWVQATENCKLTINGGSFKPATHGTDASSVYVTNGTHNVTLSVTGGNFETKIGCDDVAKQNGSITGGTFAGKAREDTDPALFKTP